VRSLLPRAPQFCAERLWALTPCACGAFWFYSMTSRSATFHGSKVRPPNQRPSLASLLRPALSSPQLGSADWRAQPAWSRLGPAPPGRALFLSAPSFPVPSLPVLSLPATSVRALSLPEQSVWERARPELVQAPSWGPPAPAADKPIPPPGSLATARSRIRRQVA